MNRKWISIAVIVTLIGVGALVLLRTPSGVCDVCGRDACRAMTFVVSRRGPDKKVCCPRCGLFYVAHHPGTRALTATDFATGQPIDAAGAVYVEGSDASLCASPESNADPLHGTAAYARFDRCLPSVLAFSSEREAAAFIREHGGRVVSLDDLRQTVPGGNS